jgi:hypothetical protein
VVLPVPAALLAAAGFAAVQERLRWNGGWGRRAAVAAAAAIGLGGTVLFDVVNPRILSASSLGIMFRVLRPEAADRVVVVDYPKDAPGKNWFFAELIATYAGKRPVGYVEYGGGRFLVPELAAEGKDLVFWSSGLEQDRKITRAVCTQSPGATLYEIWDEARLGRAYAARTGHLDWEPSAPTDRWRSWQCASRSAGRAQEPGTSGPASARRSCALMARWNQVLGRALTIRATAVTPRHGRQTNCPM